MKLAAMILIVLGVVGLAYGGITWSRREKVVDLGAVEITHEKKERVPLPPVAGGVCLVAGVVLLAASRRGA